MKIDYDGRLWDFSLEEMDVAQCEAVERYVGKGLGEWANQMGAGGVKAIIALWWVMRAQAGGSPGPVDEPGGGFRPVKLLAAFHAADAAQASADAVLEAEAIAAAQAEPDPTRTPAAGSPASAPAADGPTAESLPG